MLCAGGQKRLGAHSRRMEARVLDHRTRLPAGKGANGLNVTDFHISLSPVDCCAAGHTRVLLLVMTSDILLQIPVWFSAPDSTFSLLPLTLLTLHLVQLILKTYPTVLFLVFVQFLS